MRSVSTLALTAALGVVGLALAPTANAAGPDDSVHYLATQLAAGGDHLTVEAGGQTYPDHGLTIDAVLAMTAAGSGGDASTAATDWVVANASGYYGYGEDVYSAATAKLLTFASARNLNPRDVGGADLVAQLRSLEADTGQFVDQSEWGDYSNTLGQSFALIGLERAGINPSTASVDFLLQQQCADGGFSLEFKDGCVSDPDATSLAVQALDVVGGNDAAVQRAADYLESRQGADGGIGGGVATEGVNANSTGVAAVAFAVTGRTEARAEALAYLRTLTFGCDTPALAGAIAYNRADFDAAVALGADAQPDGTITRATAQAVLGLSGTSYAHVTAQGQAAATPDVDCTAAGDDDAQTPTEPTQPTELAEPAEPTGTDDAAGPTTPQQPAEPVRPEMVQTDGVVAAPHVGLLGLLAAGAGGAAAALVLVLRRRPATQRH